MIEQDTIKLLRECDAGIKMGISAIDEVMKYVKNEELKKVLQNGMKDNEELKNELLEPPAAIPRRRKRAQSHCKGYVLDENKRKISCK